MNISDAYIAMQKESGIEVGDKVRVLRKAKNREMGWDNTWVEQMDAKVGQELTVVAINGAKGISLGSYSFPFFVLKSLAEDIKFKLNDSYTAIIKKDGVEVGCQTFTHAIILELAQKVADFIESSK